jgi:hypothetical protein
MTQAAQILVMEERLAPSRPYRLGTRRRRAPQGRAALPEAGASCFGRKAKAPSLDTEKLLATSVREWMGKKRTEEDIRAEQTVLQRQLNGTIYKIWQRYAREGNAPEVAKWEKQWFKLHNCQSEWIGYRAACCGERTRAIAVPIGCNHRLCPLCAWHRSQRARVKIKTMFDRLTHPVLITLTIPNKETITKHDYTLFRQKVRKFIAQHKSWILGGVYSLETTYNRTSKTWHIHVHILADASASLPSKKEKTVLIGERVYAFTAIKLKLEFDWLRLWGQAWGKAAGKGASKMRREGDTYSFENWVRDGRANRVKEWRDGAYRPIEGLPLPELAARTKWNAENRRVIDVRPVVDREGAAREVLKYITKVADFCDLPEAVEPFCDAVKGTRLIQTFGTWYGVSIDTVFDPEHLDDWGERKCACGVNHWVRIGILSRADVEMDECGKWHSLKSLGNLTRGSVPRPTIRALDVPEESENQLCNPMEMETRR